MRRTNPGGSLGIPFRAASVGGSARSLTSVILANALYYGGYHVLTIPSPTSLDFIVKGSETGVPGRQPSMTLASCKQERRFKSDLGRRECDRLLEVAPACELAGRLTKRHQMRGFTPFSASASRRSMSSSDMPK